jgi:hypothetical protein
VEFKEINPMKPALFCGQRELGFELLIGRTGSTAEYCIVSTLDLVSLTLLTLLLTYSCKFATYA